MNVHFSRTFQRLRRGFVSALPVLLLAACASAPTSAANPARSVNKITVNGKERSYILRLPPHYDDHGKYPLVMMLHGANDSAEYAEKAYHLDEKAAKENFIVVFPDSLGEFHAWNAIGNDADAKADLAFLTTLLESLPTHYAVDVKRVYVCGHSVGAIMTFRLIAQRPDLIAAAGVVAGSVGTEGDIPTPQAPVPLIMFHGKLDDVIPYGEDDPKSLGTVARNIAFWTKANGCDPKSVKTDRPVPTVERKIFPSARHADIVLYSLDNGNHMWPGGVVMPGKTMVPVQDISATDCMWDFFKEHPRP